MNSVSGVRKALAYEVQRQTAELEAGRTLQQETRRWDDPSGQTFLMRTKENAHDYRYFPDPDLMPVRTETLVTTARAALPELPAARRTRYVEPIRCQSLRRLGPRGRPRPRGLLRDRRRPRRQT